MALFQKKGELTREFTGPDGRTYVAKAPEDENAWVARLRERVAEQAKGPLPGWVESLHRTEAGDDPAGLTACRLGRAGRVVELDTLGVAEALPQIGAFLEAAHRNALFGDGWPETLRGAAHALVRAETPTDRLTERLADELPEGMGGDGRRRFAALTLADALGEEVEAAGRLVGLWRFGHALHACEASLPPEAAPALG
jgi:hypothetical protein